MSGELYLSEDDLALLRHLHERWYGGERKVPLYEFARTSGIPEKAYREFVRDMSAIEGLESYLASGGFCRPTGIVLLIAEESGAAKPNVVEVQQRKRRRIVDALRRLEGDPPVLGGVAIPKLLEHLGIDDDEFDRNLDFLLERGDVGSGHGLPFIELTKRGRAWLESFDPDREDDFECHGYKTRTKIVFHDRDGGRYPIDVDERRIELRPAPMRVFLNLVIELWKREGGWYPPGPRKKIADLGGNYHQALGRLRERFEGIVDDTSAFIENNDGKGKYRVSTHPDYIEVPSDEWVAETKRVLEADRKKKAQRRRRRQ